MFTNNSFANSNLGNEIKPSDFISGANKNYYSNVGFSESERYTTDASPITAFIGVNKINVKTYYKKITINIKDINSNIVITNTIGVNAPSTNSYDIDLSSLDKQSVYVMQAIQVDGGGLAGFRFS